MTYFMGMACSGTASLTEERNRGERSSPDRGERGRLKDHVLDMGQDWPIPLGFCFQQIVQVRAGAPDGHRPEALVANAEALSKAEGDGLEALEKRRQSA